MEPMGLYWNAERGEVRKRVPAGGHGGGVTAQVDLAAEPEEVLLWFEQNPPAKPAAPEPVEPAPPAEPVAAAEPAADAASG